MILTYFFFLSVSPRPGIPHYFQLTNVADCVKRGYIKEGETPLEVAAQRLIKDQVNVLHTIGGDDTNTQAAELSEYILTQHGGQVIVIGMPKTIDNDVFPVLQSFGAHTAAQQGARFFRNVVNECTSNPRMLILHEVMGRDRVRDILMMQRRCVDSFESGTFLVQRSNIGSWLPNLLLFVVPPADTLRPLPRPSTVRC